MKYTAYKTKEKIVVLEDGIKPSFNYIEKTYLGEHETKQEAEKFINDLEDKI